MPTIRNPIAATDGVVIWARGRPRSLSHFQQTATLLDTSLSTRGRTSRYEASLRWPAASSALQCSASRGVVGVHNHESSRLPRPGRG